MRNRGDNMRKFAFVTFDIDNTITDRFDLDVVTDIGGLGWKLKLSTIEGDIVNTLTRVIQEKQAVSLTVNLIGRGYEKYTILSQWLQKYSVPTARLALEYDDGLQARYCEGKVTELKKTEKDEFNNLSCAATFTPLTPFFINIENTIKINVSSVGKTYPFKYPYSYGKVRVENNEINNPYITEIPVTVKIIGSIFEPTIRLEQDGQEYARVQFTGLTVEEGQYLIINSAARKIYFFNGTEIEDYSSETDPRYETFLFAARGKSIISINLDPPYTGTLTGSWRQYGL